MSVSNCKEVLGDEFERRLLDLMRRWKVPGCAIALVPATESPIIKTYHLEGVCEPITTHSRFPVASCTKLVTNLALIKALETAGYVHPLDVCIKDILPEFKLSDSAATEECLVRDIIGHRWSIPPFDFRLLRAFEDSVDCLSLVKDLPMLHPFREGPGIYSSAIHEVTTPLIERLTGKSLPAPVKETILDPLGMSTTGHSAADAGASLLTGHQVRYDAAGMQEKMMSLKHANDSMGPMCGLASMRMITSIKDLAKLLAHLPTVPLFAEMSVPHRHPSTWIDEEEIAGPGTISVALDGHLMSGYTGAYPGFRSHVLHVPSLGVGIGVLTNSTEGLYLIRWIEAWVVGALTGKREQLCEKVINQIEKDRAAFHQTVMTQCPALRGSGDEKLIGNFYSPTFGSLTFTDDCNVEMRPFGNMMNMPWLPHLYGDVRPLITSMGGGRFEGCLEWTAGAEQEHYWGKQYGYPFRLEVVSANSQDEEIRVWGMAWLESASEEGPPAVYRRV